MKCLKLNICNGYLNLHRKENSGTFSAHYKSRKEKKQKVALSPSRKVCFTYLNESPLKVMKNSFCFILKALEDFILKARSRDI